MDVMEAVKNLSGRPRKWNVKDLTEAIKKYFNETPREEWRITSLAIALDTNRETLCQWANEGREFSDIIKKAKSFIEDKYATNCETRGNAGDIFILKNMGWKDKQEIEHSGGVRIENLLDDIDD